MRRRNVLAGLVGAPLLVAAARTPASAAGPGYWIDVARANDQWGRPAQCYRALTIAERLNPEEVHARPVVRILTSKLLGRPQQTGMAGLRGLAARVGVAT